MVNVDIIYLVESSLGSIKPTIDDIIVNSGEYVEDITPIVKDIAEDISVVKNTTIEQFGEEEIMYIVKIKNVFVDSAKRSHIVATIALPVDHIRPDEAKDIILKTPHLLDKITHTVNTYITNVNNKFMYNNKLRFPTKCEVKYISKRWFVEFNVPCKESYVTFLPVTYENIIDIIVND